MIYLLDDLPVYSVSKRRTPTGDEGTTATLRLGTLGDKRHVHIHKLKPQSLSVILSIDLVHMYAVLLVYTKFRHTLVGVAYFPCCSGRDSVCEQPRHLKAILVHRGLILLTLTTVPLTHTSRPNTLARSVRNGVNGS